MEMPRTNKDYAIMNPEVEDYIYSLMRKRDKVLSEIEKDAEKNGVPIVGPLVGNFLYMLANACRARKILEVGTATGYSGIWFARAIEGNSGKLVTIENDPSRKKIAEENFRRAGLDHLVEIRGGDAKKIVPDLSRAEPLSYDLVFLDVGDKTLYVDLLEPCLNLTRAGGFLIADNTLWSGAVADKYDRTKETTTIRRFNEKVSRMENVSSLIVPLRDGVMVAYKKSS
jgi:caffeoyl-CoA O-methyltransferase